MNMKRDEQALFVGILERYLNSALKSKFSYEKLNRSTLFEIKNEIKVRFMKIFSECNFNVSEKSIEFLVDEYFGSVNINGSTINEMLTTTQHTSVRDVPSQDLDILIELFRDTTIGDKLEESRRSR